MITKWEGKGAERAIVPALSFAKFYNFQYVLKFLCPFKLETKELRFRRLFNALGIRG